MSLSSIPKDIHAKNKKILYREMMKLKKRIAVKDSKFNKQLSDYIASKFKKEYNDNVALLNYHNAMQYLDYRKRLDDYTVSILLLNKTI